MKIVGKRNEILNGIQTVQSVVSTRINLPILSNILLEAEDSNLNLIASDLEMFVRKEVDVEVIRSGRIIIPARKFYEIINGLQDQDVIIEIDKDDAIISCGRSIFNIPKLDPTEFPKFPILQRDISFTLPFISFKNMIKKTIFATSTDKIRYTLNGILFILNKGCITMVATDGYRLSFVKYNLEDIEQGLNLSIIIPTKVLNELNKTLNRDEIEVVINKKQIGFFINNTILISRLIEGNFPDYKKVIPKNQNKIEVKKEDLLDACRRVSIINQDILKFSLQKDNLIITANSEIGGVKEEIGILFNSPPIDIGFNPKYLIDVLKNIESREVIIELNDSLNPILLRPSTLEDYFFVVMPMRI
ncbi:MAG: DNA polymerase III subunit beta [bacterium]|nr:DNA polymerase III subunit beta [bacterium]